MKIVFLLFVLAGCTPQTPSIQRFASSATLPATCTSPTVIEGVTWCCCRFDADTNRCQRIVNMDLAPESCQ
jgi:hypothetical protein